MARAVDKTVNGDRAGDGQAVVAGVCAGLASRWRIHPNWLRVAFLVGALASWFVTVGYLGLALLLPHGQETGSLSARLRQRLALLLEGVNGTLAAGLAMGRRWMELRSSDDETERGRALAGGALLALGIYFLLRSFGLLEWLTFGRFFAIGMCLLGVALLVPSRRDDP